MKTIFLSDKHMQLYDTFLLILKSKKFQSHPDAEILSFIALCCFNKVFL